MSSSSGKAYLVAMKFCPKCGRPLALRLIEYRERPGCDRAEGGCGFIDFGRYTLGAGGLVVQTDETGRRQALLIQRGEEPNRGGWTIPGGFVEFDETAQVGVVREVEEETGLHCEVLGLAGYRNRTDPGDNTSYLVFLLQATGGQLRAEPIPEIMQARFFSLEELEKLDHLAPLSFEFARAAIEAEIRPLQARTVSGLAGRPSFTVFM